MDDTEIYDKAVTILSDITKDLNENVYSDLKGSLILGWRDEEVFNAYAGSSDEISCPPLHKITINYELVRQVYRDAEDFCNFADNELKGDRFQILFAHLKSAPTLPNNLSKDDCCFIMFVGSLTWIYFHELGHLKQEHGYIRKKWGANSDTLIQECSVTSSSKLKGRTSAIYHVTELAADFEAMTLCITEITRQFKGNKLSSAIYMLVCGISCVFHRFNSEKSLTPHILPIGSHPHPIIRMEFTLTQLFEILDLMKNLIGLNLNREGIVNLYSRSGHSGALFWLWKYARPKNIENGFFIEGALNRPNMYDYYRTIIKTWDEIEPEITQLHRFNYNPLSMLQFSDEFRQKLGM